MEVVTGEEEILDEKTRLNEYLMTSLRTTRGVDMEYLQREWGEKIYRQILKLAEPFIQGKRLIVEDNRLVLSLEGMFIADYIIGGLFL